MSYTEWISICNKYSNTFENYYVNFRAYNKWVAGTSKNTGTVNGSNHGQDIRCIEKYWLSCRALSEDQPD